MDMSVLIGPAGAEPEPALADLARDLAGVLGFELERLPGREPGREMFHGGTDATHVFLKREVHPSEPFLSHPFDLEFSYTAGPELPYAEGLFERLRVLDRYRLLLLVGEDCVRSTHFPCEQW